MCGVSAEVAAPRAQLLHLQGQATAWEHVRGGNSAWPKEQDWRSFLLCKTVECLACNEGAEDLCFKTDSESIRLKLGETQSFRSGVVLPGF